MKTVRILGSAPNLQDMLQLPDGDEMWMANNPKVVRKYLTPEVFERWTRWFNLHSRHHMETTYPVGFNWYRMQDGSRPFYTQVVWHDIPGCVEFPGKQLLEAFPEAGRYHTCSITWMTALAIHEGFERIEYYGLVLRDKKRPQHQDYTFERRCFFYWVNKAKERGIEVTYPSEILTTGSLEAGDPAEYTGTLYGYETKPEERRVKCYCPPEVYWTETKQGIHQENCPSHVKNLGDQLDYQLVLPMPKES